MFNIPWNFWAAGILVIVALFGDRLVPGLQYLWSKVPGFPSVTSTAKVTQAGVITVEQAQAAVLLLVRYQAQKNKVEPEYKLVSNEIKTLGTAH